MEAMDLGALGFWIFIAALVVAGIWSDSRKKAEKHETLRRIVEKTGTIDEAKLQELFAEPASEAYKPGGGYRTLRIAGTIVRFIGAAILTLFLVAAGLAFLFGRMDEFSNIDALFAVFAIPAGIAMAGYVLFFSSRFAEPPASARNEPPAPQVESRLAIADLQKAADTLVIALACAGDDSAFAEVLRRRQARVRKFMYHLCRQPALGDDLWRSRFS
jgi:hypothetical protein